LNTQHLTTVIRFFRALLPMASDLPTHLNQSVVKAFEQFVRDHERDIPGKAWISLMEMSRHADLHEFRNQYLKPKLEERYLLEFTNAAQFNSLMMSLNQSQI
jgi:hypothetical protein